MSVFGAYARYYDLLYRDKDYAAEAAYVHGLIQQHAPGAQTILDLGCGTGAHAAQFAEMGYEVHGVDMSEDMLRIARVRKSQLRRDVAARLDFSLGDVRSVRVGREFDVVTALFHVVSYQVADEDLAQTFATANLHLAPAGLLLFDCWYGPAVLSDPPVVRVKRFDDADIDVLRIARPKMITNKNMTEVEYQILITDIASGQTEEIHERHQLRYLFEPELMQCLGSAGLQPVHFSEWLSDAAPSDDTWNVILVGRSATQSGG